MRTRLAELLASISLVTDLGMGQPPESGMRACLLATSLARRRGLTERQVRDVYFTTLVRYLGCTSFAHEEALAFGGDDIALRSKGALVDDSNPRELLPFLLLQPGRGLPLPRRVLVVIGVFAHGQEFGRQLAASHCEVASRLAERLGLPGTVQTGLYQLAEQWNGKGGPQGLTGEEISVPARYALLATRVILLQYMLGEARAAEIVHTWAGTVFDPDLVRSLEDERTQLMDVHSGSDVLDAVLDAEPEPRLELESDRLDMALEALGDLVDLKIPYLRGHSRSVAAIARAAALQLGLGEEGATELRRAGHVHDIGRVGIANGVWEKPASLSTGDWEQIRLHPYHGERILSRTSALTALAELAGAHHERLDGSGYHRQSRAGGLSIGAKILAVADVYSAMTQERPYRAALGEQEAADMIAAEVRDGKLDGVAAEAVLEAAGLGSERIKREWPAGLSDREVDVLRLLARGAPNKAVAKQLGISPKTVGHHVQHIYDKIGVSTRAAAALFAMENALVR